MINVSFLIFALFLFLCIVCGVVYWYLVGNGSKKAPEEPVEEPQDMIETPSTADTTHKKEKHTDIPNDDSLDIVDGGEEGTPELPVNEDLLGKVIKYKGYSGSVEYHSNQGYFGKILFISENHNYRSNTQEGLIAAFEAAVENYLNKPEQKTIPVKRYLLLTLATNEEINVITLCNSYLGLTRLLSDVYIVRDVYEFIDALNSNWKNFRVGGVEPRLPAEGYGGLYDRHNNIIYINKTHSRDSLKTFAQLYIHETLHAKGMVHGDLMTKTEIDVTNKVLETLQEEGLI